MAYDEALLFSYLWILPVTSFLLHCAEGSVNGLFSSKVHTTMPLAGSHQQRHFLLLWFLLPTSLTTQDWTAYLLHVRIRRSIQRPLFMGPMSLHRGLFGIRALRAVSVNARATIWDLAFSIWVWCIPKLISFRFCIFGYQYIVAGNSVIGYNSVTLLFNTNWNVFLE